MKHYASTINCFEAYFDFLEIEGKRGTEEGREDEKLVRKSVTNALWACKVKRGGKVVRVQVSLERGRVAER